MRNLDNGSYSQVTAGRDSTARVWDMRTKVNIHTLGGHTNTISSVICQATDPQASMKKSLCIQQFAALTEKLMFHFQVITGSNDQTIRLWDLAAGKSICTLTNHKKSVRAVVAHPTLNMFASASPDNIKQWKCPEGKFIQVCLKYFLHVNISFLTQFINY